VTHSERQSEHWLALRRRWQPHRSCTPVRPLPGHYWPSPSSWGLLRPIEGGVSQFKKSCWIYAVLKALGTQLHHATGGHAAVPSASDLAFEDQMRRAVGAWLRSQETIYNEMDAEDQASLGESPQYAANGQLQENGGYSSTEMMVAAAAIFGCTLVIVHRRGLRSPEHRHLFCAREQTHYWLTANNVL
jgi:hypothetical protein